MKQKIYQIDAFADKVFSGNPAAVCILDAWIDAKTMQQIAMENNLAETAFAVKKEEQYEIRWFTPETEVDLCGHATLATAYVLYTYYRHTAADLKFYSHRSGELLVRKQEDESIQMNFPSDVLQTVESMPALEKAIGAVPNAIFKGKTDYLLIYDSQQQIERIHPNFHLLNQLDCRGVIITGPGENVDFVSRFFAPQCGIPEDPVTGSAHTSLTPYWAKVLNKNKLSAKQLSPRGGTLLCEFLGERVSISGNAVPYLEGEITI